MTENNFNFQKSKFGPKMNQILLIFIPILVASICIMRMSICTWLWIEDEVRLYGRQDSCLCNISFLLMSSMLSKGTEMLIQLSTSVVTGVARVKWLTMMDCFMDSSF